MSPDFPQPSIAARDHAVELRLFDDGTAVAAVPNEGPRGAEVLDSERGVIDNGAGLGDGTADIVTRIQTVGVAANAEAGEVVDAGPGVVRDITVTAGKTLMFDRDEMLAAADKHKICVIGSPGQNRLR